MKKTIKITTLLFSILSAIVMILINFYNKSLPAEYYTDNSASILSVNNMIMISSSKNDKTIEVESNRLGNKYEVTLKLFNLFPIKNAEVKVENRHYVTPGGEIFGIKLYTKGVVIVGLSEIDTVSGKRNPAKEAGLAVGDIITKINGKEITSNYDISKIVSGSNGERLEVVAVRDQKEFTVRFNPMKSLTGDKYMAGIWVRDSSAGIGTLTFFDENSGLFGGLGHAVCDPDTGKKLPVNESQSSIVSASVSGVTKGIPGNAGALLGHFCDGEISGSLLSNGDMGVYGVLDGKPTVKYQKVPVAFCQEVEIGDAQIISTVDDGNPAYYDCKIERINYMGSKSQNMTVKITDKKLLNYTGGIVQGMSGSPIIQNGRLIGAVTHVFVNDPTRGFAIFAETMCKQADYVDSCQTDKAA